MSKHYDRKKNSLGKFSWAIIVVFLVGIVLCLWKKNNTENNTENNTVFLSIGCSLIAAAGSAFIMDLAQDETIDGLAELCETNNKTNKHILEKLDTLSSPNNRIIRGVHLTDQVYPLIDECIKSGNKLEMDVMGFELFNFWAAHKEQLSELLKNKKLHLRLITQDPTSPFFSDMTDYEGRKMEKCKENIYDLAKTVKDIRDNLDENDKQQIEMKWMRFPASITMTRVNNQVYVRARLVDQIYADEISFFEKYYESDRPYQTFMFYFEHSWAKSSGINNVTSQQESINNN